MSSAVDYSRNVPPDRLPEASVSELIRRYLRERPSASPADVAEWLAQFDIHLSPDVIDSLLAAMKTG